MSIALPTEPTVAGSPSPDSLVIYGGPKIGKSKVCTQLGRQALIVDMQNGYKEYPGIMKVQPENFGELIQVFSLLIDAGKPYKYLVLDPMDRVEDMCEIEATNRYRLSSAGKNFRDKSVCDLPNGYGYRWLRLPFKEMMTAAQNAAPHVIYIAHVRDKFLRDEATDAQSVEIDLTRGCGNILTGYASGVLHATRRKPAAWKPGMPDKFDLWMSSLSGDKLCGCRSEHLAGTEFMFSSATERRAMWEKIYIDDPAFVGTQANEKTTLTNI